MCAYHSNKDPQKETITVLLTEKKIHKNHLLCVEASNKTNPKKTHTNKTAQMQECKKWLSKQGKEAEMTNTEMFAGGPCRT